MIETRSEPLVRRKVFERCQLWDRVVWTSNRAIEPMAPALWTSSVSMSSDFSEESVFGSLTADLEFPGLEMGILQCAEGCQLGDQGIPSGTPRPEDKNTAGLVRRGARRGG